MSSSTSTACLASSASCRMVQGVRFPAAPAGMVAARFRCRIWRGTMARARRRASSSAKDVGQSRRAPSSGSGELAVAAVAGEEDDDVDVAVQRLDRA